MFDTIFLSKKISWLLRHGALESKLPMSEAGWVKTDVLIEYLGISKSDLEYVVQTNTKSRYEFQGDCIRASQGHSQLGVPVTLEGLEASWSIYTSVVNCWHGTSIDALAGIATKGVLPKQRTHVHLAKATDSNVGKRDHVHVLLEISSTRLRAQDIMLFESPNGVVLVRSIPKKCIVGLRPIVKRARKQEQALKSLFSF